MRKPAFIKGRLRTQVSQEKSLPAPVGGWNARDSVANMAETDANVMINWFPETNDVRVRDGYADHVTGITGDIETLMPYNKPDGTQALFAAANGEIYNVTTAGAVGAAVQTSLSNNRWQHVNFTNSAGTTFLCNFNGEDSPRYWDGSSWTTVTGVSTPAITGLTTSNIISAHIHKRRMWLVEKDSLKVWYLPIDSVGGAAKSYDLDGLFTKGGYVMAIETWTLDSGEGIDDLIVAISSEGQVAVFKGTDPQSVSTWSMVGVWNIGDPIGRRCMIKYKGDCLVICKDGVYALSKALIGSTAAAEDALTYKINKAMRDAAFSYSGNFGWQLLHFPKNNMLILNVPVSGSSEQYVMNTITGAWGRFQNVDANCWAIIGGDAYFGENGEVKKFGAGVWNDDSANIDTNLQQAYSYFDARGRLKHFKAMRPVLLIEGTVESSIGVDIDFDQTTSVSTASFSPTDVGLWDTDTWDDGTWGGLQRSLTWLTVEGVGTAAALRFLSSSQTELRLQATDHVYEYGGVIG